MHFLHNSLGKEKSDKKTRKSGFNWLSKFEISIKNKAVHLLRTIRLISSKISLPFY